MKATELMLGDWVYAKVQVDDTGTEPVFERTPKRVIDLTNSINGIYVEGTSQFAGAEIEPIPLTAEILEENGLWGKDPDRNPNCLIAEATTTNFNDAEGKPHSWVQIQDISSIECMRWYIKIWGKGNLGMSGYIGYVHELQHALRLCNIEKEIIL